MKRRVRADGLIALLFLHLAASAAAQILTVPLPEGSATDAFLQVRLSDGAAILLDRLRRDPTSPRVEALSESLFGIVGRQTAAREGEIFLVPLYENDGGVKAALYIETPIGYMAFFDDLGRRGALGKFGSVLGRPLEAVAATDGNFAILQVRRGAGRSEGLYLYHASTGRALWLPGLAERDVNLTADVVAGLPVMTGRIAAAPLAVGGRLTAAYLLLDTGSGEIYRCEMDDSRPLALAVRKLDDLRLFDAFPQQGEHLSPQRFVAATLVDADGTTRQALIFDTSGGGVGRIEGLDTVPRLIGGSLRYDGDFPPVTTEAARTLSVVPDTAANGRTVGLWLVESSGAMVYVSDPGSPTDMRFAAITPKR